MVSGLHPAIKPMHRTLSLRRGKEHMRDRQTDSERILYYLIDEINKCQDERGWPLTPEENYEYKNFDYANL